MVRPVTVQPIDPWNRPATMMTRTRARHTAANETIKTTFRRVIGAGCMAVLWGGLVGGFSFIFTGTVSPALPGINPIFSLLPAAAIGLVTGAFIANETYHECLSRML